MSACATLAIEAPPLKSLGVVKAVESDQAGKAGEAPVHPRGHRIVPVEIDVPNVPADTTRSGGPSPRTW
jgi:hypothetical protein